MCKDKKMAIQKFNLVDEPWLPMEGQGLLSLHDIFARPDAANPGGSPVQKISTFKLLLAICQAALTPKKESDWESLSPEKLAEAAVSYLEKHKDEFWLYGDKPFLQMPSAAGAKIASYSAFNPEIASGNTTVLLQSQIQDVLSDAERACLLIRLQGFATGGKKVDNTIVLSPGYEKTKGAPAGPSLGFLGFLHTLVLGDSLRETLWLNLFTEEFVQSMKVFSGGVGTPPWEKNLLGENCPAAQALCSSLMGRLVPMSRFCLLSDAGIHITEGVRHKGYKEGVADPTVSVNFSGKDPKALWVDPDKRPWRNLVSTLSFLKGFSADDFVCPQLRLAISRIRHMETAHIWSGGIRVSSNAGEQYPSGNDDYVDSQTDIPCEYLGETWFVRFAKEMEKLEWLEKALYASVAGYCTALKLEGAKKQKSAQATSVFWQKAEVLSSELIDECGQSDPEQLKKLRLRFYGIARTVYDQVCPHETPRQLTAWVSHSIGSGKYLNDE